MKNFGKSTYFSKGAASSLLLRLTKMLTSSPAHKRPHEQNLFGIVQGGLDPVLRLSLLTLM